MTEAPATLERVEAVLRELPPQLLNAVLLFAEYVRDRAAAEDQVLWSLVEAERAYRQDQPEEVETYTTAEELLAALNDPA